MGTPSTQGDWCKSGILLLSAHKVVNRRKCHPEKKGYLLPGVPGFCQNVPGTAGAAAGAAAAATAGAAAATALIFTTTQVVAKIAAAAPAAAPAVPGTFS